MDKMISINKERLIYARNFYNLSIEEVALKTKIKQEQIILFENGTDYPSYSQLNSLADFYKQPLLFFFLNSKPQLDRLIVAFRKLEQNTDKIISKKVKEMIEKANIYRLNLSEINEEKHAISFKMLVQNVNKNFLTEWLREKLNLSLEKQKDYFKKSETLLEYIREKFYAIGIYIFKDSFQDKTASGLCLYDDNFPVILLNNKTTFNRQIFTVFHEFYHLYSQETDVDFTNKTEEKACDVFASEFLIPPNDFKKMIVDEKNYEDNYIISNLAEMYCVSRDAIRYRLLKEGKISPEYYNKQQEDDIRNIDSQITGGNFYYTKMSYLGKPYLNQVFSQYYSGQIPISKVGMYTQLKTAHVSKLASNLFGGDF